MTHEEGVQVTFNRLQHYLLDNEAHPFKYTLFFIYVFNQIIKWFINTFYHLIEIMKAMSILKVLK